MSIEKQIETGMIEASNGKYCICLDKKSDWNGWLFEKHPDGQWVSLRLAMPQEILAAQRKLDLLEMAAQIPVRG